MVDIGAKRRAWFTHVWPFAGARHLVLADYAAIGAQHPHFLTDLALRGGVYREFDPATDRDLASFNGRRELALETIKLCKADPSQLFALVPEKPREEKSR